LARQTRSRRTREAGDAQPSRSRVDQQQELRRRKAAAEAKTQVGQRKERQGGFRSFVGECVAELKKVDWPNQRQIFTATVVVLIAIFVVGLFLWICDEAFSRLVKNVLLGE
jgi:preprotein translocase subunit SecE